MKLKLLCLSLFLLPALAKAELYISIVEGLGGMPEYQEQFDDQRESVVAAAHSMTAAERVVSFVGEDASREKILAHFTNLKRSMTGDDRMAIYLIGHGSFDGTEYKFNLPGPDITGADIKNILENLPGQNHFLVNTSSTSGAMIEAILNEKADATDSKVTTTPSDYILIAATRNGNERNATHFGRFFVEALSSSAADLNKNNNISIQEAFDFADRAETDYFAADDKLATEHPQLRGEGAAQFSLARITPVETTSTDPLLAQLLERRVALEAKIEDLQLRRSQLDNADYLAQLQVLILESAELAEQIESEQAAANGANLLPTLDPLVIEVPETTGGDGATR